MKKLVICAAFFAAMCTFATVNAQDVKKDAPKQEACCNKKADCKKACTKDCTKECAKTCAKATKECAKTKECTQTKVCKDAKPCCKKAEAKKK
ncbi:MAG: hypothetical protein RR365_07630 [Bacteroides sp.]